jgi:hypothetical protein
MAERPFFELDRDALARALEGALEEFGLDGHEGWSLECFDSERTAGAIEHLAQRAFQDWGCLKQPPGFDYEAIVHDLFSDGGCPLVVALRPASGGRAQLASPTIDGARLADGQRERQGMGVLAEILETLVLHANALIEGAHALPLPTEDGDD